MCNKPKCVEAARLLALEIKKQIAMGIDNPSPPPVLGCPGLTTSGFKIYRRTYQSIAKLEAYSKFNISPEECEAHLIMIEQALQDKLGNVYSCEYEQYVPQWGAMFNLYTKLEGKFVV